MAELFYPLGLGLTALAVVVSFFGLRNKEFPGSKGALAGGIAIFAVLVFATMATGVKNAEEEQDHRENQEAEEAAQETELENEAAEAEDVGQAGGGAAGAQLEQDTSGQSEGTGGQSGAKGGQAGGTVDLSAPEDGSLAFEPDSLQAPAGNVAIKFTNPAAVAHDVHIEGDGEDLAASDVVADGETTEASADLEPGDYTFYCSIPGHREGGMEGTLTVE
jgi:plastocyanin